MRILKLLWFRVLLVPFGVIIGLLPFEFGSRIGIGESHDLAQRSNQQVQENPSFFEYDTDEQLAMLLVGKR